MGCGLSAVHKVKKWGKGLRALDGTDKDTDGAKGVGGSYLIFNF